MLLAISERAGSDSIAIQEMAATDFEEYREVNELILQGRKLGSDVLIAEAKARNAMIQLLLVRQQMPC